MSGDGGGFTFTSEGGSCPTRSPLDVATQSAGDKHAVPVPTAYRLHGIPGNTPTGEPGLANRVLVSRIRNRSCTRGRANMSMSQHSLPSLAASLEGPLSGRRSLPMCRVHAPRSRCSLRFAWRTPRRVCARTPPPYRPLVAGPLRESVSETEVTAGYRLSVRKSRRDGFESWPGA